MIEHDAPFAAGSASEEKRASHRGVRGQRGQAFVEFALVIPMLLVFVFGIIEFGVLMMDQMRIQNAAAAGARAGSLKDADGADAVAAANAGASGLVSCPLAAPSAVYGGSPEQVTVTVTCTYAPITPFGSLVASSLNLAMDITGTALMRVER